MYRTARKALGVGALMTALAAFPATAQTTLTVTPVTSCTGAHVHVLPIVHWVPTNATGRSSESSGGSDNGPSGVLELANLSPTATSTVQACAYSDDGTLLGGGSFALSPSTRLVAIEEAGQALTVHQIFGLTGFPSQIVHAVITTDQPTGVQGGGVGPHGHVFFIEHGAHPGSIVGAAPLTQVPVETGTLMLVNTASQAAAYTVEFLDNSGNALATATTASVPAFGRIQATLASLAGQSTGTTPTTMLRVTAPSGGAGAGWVVTVEPQEYERTAFVLGVVQP